MSEFWCSNWEQKQVGELCDVIDPHPSHRAPREEPNGIFFLGIGDLKEDGEVIGDKARRVSPEIFDEHQDYYRITDNTIGFCRVASVGKVIEFRSDYPFKITISPTLAIIEPKDIDKKFLAYCLRSRGISDQVSSLSSGSTRESLGIKILRELKVPVPPLPEQKKIAEILSGIDKEISRHQEKIEALRFLKKSTADALIHQEKFSLKPLQEVIGKGGSIQDGDWIESKDQDQNGNIRLVQLADIQEGHFMQKSSRFMNQEKANALNVTLLQEGDLLVARMPDPIGRSCIFPGSTQDCVTVVDIAILRSNECNMKWLMHTINTSAVRNQIEELATGTTRKRISRGRLSELCIPYPEKTEQEYIAEQISSIDTALATLQNCIEKTKLLRSAISSDLLSGRKRVSV